MDRKTFVYVIMALLCLMLFWRLYALKQSLELEETRHRQTKQELVQANEDAARWQAACEEAVRAADAQKELALDCLQREEKSRRAAAEKKEILSGAVLQPQKKSEGNVVDDETRKKIAERLNRPL